ncbi:MAG: hypothetical protein EG823_04370 [Actinobacteria bacterium]|nr:hypothetical protein [Actinomycetota bacterium]
MTEAERKLVDRYLREVRRGLRGLPTADADDTIEEMRAHLFEEIGERGDAAAVVADFGGALEVASAIVERRVRPEDSAPVPQASLGRRYSAWATDVLVGFGPMLLVPTAITLIVWMFFATEAGLQPVWIHISDTAAHWWLTALGYEGLAAPEPILVWEWLLAAGLTGWAAFYWLTLRRTHSSSLGMWMAGLRAVRVNDDRIVVRERDIAQNAAPLGSEAKRWWVCLAAVPTGCFCILLLLYYLWMCVGPFLPPRVIV